MVPPRPAEARGHGGRRELVFIVVALVSIAVLQVAVAGAYAWRSDSGPPLAVSVTILVVGLLAAHGVVVHRYHGGAWEYVGLDARAWRWPAVASGAFLGAFTIGLPSLLLLLSGALRVESIAPSPSEWRQVPGLLVILVPAALWEELLLRGYTLSVLRERLGTWTALALTSLLFGALHVQNAGATVLSTAAVALAGIFLGLIRLTSGSLVAAWAAHLAWNLTMAFALRTPVSGIDLTTGGYRVVDAGPDWLTGGPWGPEGGAPAMLGLGLASWYLMRRLRRVEHVT